VSARGRGKSSSPREEEKTTRLEPRKCSAAPHWPLPRDFFQTLSDSFSCVPRATLDRKGPLPDCPSPSRRSPPPVFFAASPVRIFVRDWLALFYIRRVRGERKDDLSSSSLCQVKNDWDLVSGKQDQLFSMMNSGFSDMWLRCTTTLFTYRYTVVTCTS
jgi:hypothetical protein